MGFASCIKVVGFAHTHLKPFEKGFKNSKTFNELDYSNPPRVYYMYISSGDFLVSKWLGCNFGLKKEPY